MWVKSLRILSCLTVALLAGAAPLAQAVGVQAGPPVYLPFVANRSGCANVGGSFDQGLAIQFDEDNPPRPANLHADKNLKLRGYQATTMLFTPGLIDYGPGSEDPSGNTPPQLATLFSPARSTINTAAGNFYQINDWNWASSPTPGTRGSPLTARPVTALGLPSTPGETLYTPSSTYLINAGIQAMVVYADADSITIKYSREDSTATATGYAVFVSNICTDPVLLALYTSLDGGARNVFSGKGSQTYNLPYLRPGQAFGTALGNSVIVAVKDGPFEDPRSCQGWWLTRPNGPGSCPLRNGTSILSFP